MKIRPDMFEAEEKMSRFDLYCAPKRKSKATVAVTIVIIAAMVPLFAWIAFDHAYSNAVAAIDAPNLEGVK